MVPKDFAAYFAAAAIVLLSSIVAKYVNKQRAWGTYYSEWLGHGPTQVRTTSRLVLFHALLRGREEVTELEVAAHKNFSFGEARENLKADL